MHSPVAGVPGQLRGGGATQALSYTDVVILGSMGRGPDLRRGPSFERPPVAEVAMAVYFSPRLVVPTAELAGLWQKWRDRYPLAEDKPALPRLPPPGLQPSGGQSWALQLAPAIPNLRMWFLSRTRDRVIQLQPDRLVLNWRRTADDQPYPRYTALVPEFRGLLADTIELCRALEQPVPLCNQVELTYINPIPLSSLPPPAGLEQLLSPWTGATTDTFLPAPTAIQIQAQYPMVPPLGHDPVGSLHVLAARGAVQRIAESAPEDGYLLQLFARGAPSDQSADGAQALLDLAHWLIVNGFRSITTPQMHSHWGLRREEVAPDE